MTGIGPFPELSQRARRRLKSLGHDLKPVILVGDKGITDALVAECERALTHHELIKIKTRGRRKPDRDAAFRQIAEATGAVLIHAIGGVGLFYRPNPEQPRIDVG